MEDDEEEEDGGSGHLRGSHFGEDSERAGGRREDSRPGQWPNRSDEIVQVWQRREKGRNET